MPAAHPSIPPTAPVPSHPSHLSHLSAPVAPVAPLAPRRSLAHRTHPEPDSLESRIGGRWLLNIGIAAIVIGVAYFEKWAIDNNWISETARVIQGGVLGRRHDLRRRTIRARRLPASTDR